MATPLDRKARVVAHAHVDYLWEEGYMTRDEVYQWVQNVMGLPPAEAHIAKMNARQCAMLSAYAEQKLASLIERENDAPEC